jgi:hypothetical protein
MKKLFAKVAIPALLVTGAVLAAPTAASATGPCTRLGGSSISVTYKCYGGSGDQSFWAVAHCVDSSNYKWTSYGPATRVPSDRTKYTTSTARCDHGHVYSDSVETL